MRWRHTAREDKGSYEHSHVQTYGGLLASREEGLDSLQLFLASSKSNYGEALRWVSLEESDDDVDNWAEVHRLYAS